MSLLGKILAILNVFGVLGFGTIAIMDYGRRQGWEYSNFRHDLAVEGTPVDNKDESPRDREGYTLVKRMTKKTLKDLYPNDPEGAAPETQKKEAERVRDALNAKLGEAGSDRAKRVAELARILQPVAETGVEHEKLLSAQVHLADENSLQKFKQALTAAIPFAVEPLLEPLRRVPPGPPLLFEIELQRALRDQPGDDRWDLVLVFVQRLPREGGTLVKAAEVAKAAADEVDKKAEVKKLAADDLDKAKAASFIADVELREDPKNLEKLNKQKMAKKALQDAETAYMKATAEAKLLPLPRDAAALAFLQTVRNDRKKTKVAEFVDEVAGEMLESMDQDLTNQFNQLIAEAVDGTRTLPEGATSQTQAETRRRRQLTIARLLMVGLEALHPDVVTKSPEEAAQDANYKRFVNVVGLETAATSLNERIMNLRRVYQDLEGTLRDERLEFWTKHNEKIADLRTRAIANARLEERLSEISKQAEDQASILRVERKRVDEHADELRESRKKTAEQMAGLVKLNNELFDVRVAMRDAIRNNQKYLRKIAELEGEVRYLETQYDRQQRESKKRTRTAP